MASTTNRKYRNLIALAFVVGIVFGSWEQISERIRANHPDSNASTRTGGEQVDALETQGDDVAAVIATERSTGSASADQSEARSINTIYAAAGLRFRPYYEGTEFVGYEVAASPSDSRFAVGDVVIGVNGDLLADSPMDDEYFMASIADQTAVLDIDRSNRPVQ